MKKLLYILLAGVFFGGCSDDGEELKPSHKDRNWFVIQDDPGHALHHAIYELYEKWDVPVYYNDTIGQDTLYWHLDGTPQIHYEILHTRYFITGEENKYFKFVLTKNEMNLMRVVRLLDEEVLQLFPESVRPRSYLLCDTVTKDEMTYVDPAEGDGRIVAACRKLNTTIIGNIETIDEQTPAERKLYCAEIVAEEVACVLDNGHREALREFYKISNNAYPDAVNGTIYGQFIGFGNFPYKPYDQIGFLGASPSRYPNKPITEMYTAPTELEDLQMFLTAFYQYTEAEFTALYGNNALVMNKYGILKAFIAKL